MVRVGVGILLNLVCMDELFNSFDSIVLVCVLRNHVAGRLR